ncbi:MAG: glycine cleavage T C-terminal barrel domain-containing protein [Pirellulales bacterium]
MGDADSAGLETQYVALRRGCGVVSLRGWSSVTLAGGDRQKFLHNFCTNDIKRLKPGEGCEAFFTNVKGKVIGHGIVSCRENELVVIGVPGQAATLMPHLDRYLIREDVQLSDSSDDRCFYLVAGGSGEIDSVFAGETLRQCVGVTTPCCIVGSDAERLIETSASKAAAFEAALVDAGGALADVAFEAARIEAGFPLFGIDFNEENLPQEVGRDKQAISFTKGCYLGQETVARIDALGHVNQRLVGVRFEGSAVPAAGAELKRAGGAVGRVTSAVLSPRLRAPLALAMVRREANEVGTRLESPVGAGEVVALPLGF